jgi:hypothetical protein
MSTTQKLIDLNKIIEDFISEFGEELEMCSPDAHEQLMESLEKEGDELKSVFESIMEEYADDLEACHPEAFEFLYENTSKIGISI